jgi:phage regulator Rha-like protein
MTSSLISTTNQPLTMSSREISAYTGKLHKNVKRDISSLLVELNLDALDFERIYEDSINRKQTEYLLDRDLTDCLLLGYSATARLAVIKRWKELEQSAINPPMQEDTQNLSFKQEAMRAKAYLDAGAITKDDVMTRLFGNHEAPPAENTRASLVTKPMLSQGDFILAYLRRKKPQTMELLMRNVHRLENNPFCLYVKRGESRHVIKKTVEALCREGRLSVIKNKYSVIR